MQQQGELKSKENTLLESFIEQLEMKNKNYSEFAYRLELSIKKLQDEGEPEQKSGQESKPQLSGMITEFENALSHYQNINDRMSVILKKIEAFV